MNKRIRKKKKKQSNRQNILKDVTSTNISQDMTNKKHTIDIELIIKQTKNGNKLEYINLIISIVIAVIGFILTYHSNQIYQRQKEIQEKAASPAIDISVILKEESNEYKSEIVDKFIVNNVGGTADYIDCYVRPFFLVDYCELESGEELFSDGVIVPIISYSETMVKNENIGFRSGEIAHISANRNLLNIVDNLKKWKIFEVDPKDLGNKEIVHISIGYFLEINCQDLFENEWTEYYSCFPGYDEIYKEFPDQYNTEFGITKIKEDDDIFDIVKSCFGGGKIMPARFEYENRSSDEDNYIKLLNAFKKNCDKQLFYDIMPYGEYDLIEYDDGHVEVKHVK